MRLSIAKKYLSKPLTIVLILTMRMTNLKSQYPYILRVVWVLVRLPYVDKLLRKWDCI